MLRKFIPGIIAMVAAGLTFGACASLPAPLDDMVPEPAPVVSVAPMCTAFLTEDDVEVVTFMYGDTIECDVVPPQQLNIVFDETRRVGTAPWGSDESVEAAHTECLDMGGQPIWINDGWYRLICNRVDY